MTLDDGVEDSDSASSGSGVYNDLTAVLNPSEIEQAAALAAGHVPTKGRQLDFLEPQALEVEDGFGDPMGLYPTPRRRPTSLDSHTVTTPIRGGGGPSTPHRFTAMSQAFNRITSRDSPGQISWQVGDEPPTPTSGLRSPLPAWTAPGRRSLAVGQAMFRAMAGNGDDNDEPWESEGEGGQGGVQPTKQKAVFMDAQALKAQVRRNLFREAYDVSKFYKKTGIWQDIARSPRFEKITLAVIALNALWIGVDTDGNTAEILMDAKAQFQIAEHFFCFFFAFEWLTRFNSFKWKRNCLKDGWFVFDTILVFMMVGETWVLSIVILLSGQGGGGGMGNASILRMARLARLSRMARMARLLRAMPELMILIKGITAATRSVFFTLCLLCGLLYIFGIAFTQLTVDTVVGETYFATVPDSMLTCLMMGTFLDGIGVPLAMLAEQHWAFAALFFLYVLFATVTVMNMLIGVLCEVVSTVATVERETMTVTYLKDRMLHILKGMDDDGNGTISQDEFMKILDIKEAVQTLSEVGVDVIGLVGFADIIFQDDEESQLRELKFADFLTSILQFRGSNIVTVKDIIDFHKYLKRKLNQMADDISKIKEQLSAIKRCPAHCELKPVVIEPGPSGPTPIGKISIFGSAMSRSRPKKVHVSSPREELLEGKPQISPNGEHEVVMPRTPSRRSRGVSFAGIDIASAATTEAPPSLGADELPRALTFETASCRPQHEELLEAEERSASGATEDSEELREAPERPAKRSDGTEDFEERCKRLHGGEAQADGTSPPRGSSASPPLPRFLARPAAASLGAAPVPSVALASMLGGTEQPLPPLRLRVHQPPVARADAPLAF